MGAIFRYKHLGPFSLAKAVEDCTIKSLRIVASQHGIEAALGKNTDS